MSNPKLLTVKEWQALPELEFKTITDPHKQKGSVYRVLKVGAFNVQAYDKLGMKRLDATIPEIGLPLAHVDENGQTKMYRLPLDLAEWVETAISLAMSGMNAFPSNVEFGIVEGRHYAEIL